MTGPRGWRGFEVVSGAFWCLNYRITDAKKRAAQGARVRVSVAQTRTQAVHLRVKQTGGSVERRHGGLGGLRFSSVSITQAGTTIT